MAPQPGRPPARRTGGRSARVRAAVLTATLDELLTNGVDGMSIAEIARRAGVHETSIYRRWGGKSALALDAVLDRVETHVAVPDTGTLRGDLLALLHGIAAFMQTTLGETLMRIAARHDLAEYETVRSSFWSVRLGLGARILDRAQARGELRDGVDRRLAIEALVAPLSFRSLLTREPLDDEFITGVVDLILPGLVRPQPDDQPRASAT